MADVATTIELDGQYRALREEGGVVDRSARAKLVVRGPEAVDYLQGQITNDVEALAPGGGCYAALLDRKGHMRADLRVLRLGGEELWLDAEEIAREPVLRHLEMYKVGRELEVEDASATSALLSVIGPASGELTGAGPLEPEHAHRELELGGAACRAVATDLGIDLIVPAADAGAAREALAQSGAVGVSEAAAEIVRVEAGRPRFGAEMTDATIPAEAGINERAVSFSKGCYIGQETVARLHYKGKPNRHLRGLRLDGQVSPGEPIRLGEREVGTVGSACLSPALGPIALAIVRREAAPGERVAIGDGGVGAEVVELPFA
ncbi:MAG: YgfZ/GcvT domain-containing protein [Solirubrobacterales bacterium]